MFKALAPQGRSFQHLNRLTLGACLGMLAISSVFSGCSQDSVKIPVVPGRRTELSSPGASVAMLTPAQEQNIQLRTAPAQWGLMSNTLQTTGKVQAISNLMGHTYCPVPGQAVSVPVSIGQNIRQGQLLAWIRSDQIGQLETDLLQQYLQNTADMHQAKVQLALSKASSQRESQLFADKISARADMESARAQYEKDQANVEALQIKQQALITTYQSRFSLYGAPADMAKKLLSQNRIYPFIALRAARSGILINRKVNPGELVDSNKELFTIADLSKVWLVGDIYERDLENVHLQQRVRVTLDSLANRTFEGRVSFIDTMLDPQARTLEIHSEVFNRQFLLKPNMFARVAIQLGQKKALIIPSSALQRNGDNTYVYVPIAPHTYEERQVSTGLIEGTNTEVISGLQANEPVVIRGSLELKGEILKQATKSN